MFANVNKTTANVQQKLILNDFKFSSVCFYFRLQFEEAMYVKWKKLILNKETHNFFNDYLKSFAFFTPWLYLILVSFSYVPMFLI